MRTRCYSKKGHFGLPCPSPHPQDHPGESAEERSAYVPPHPHNERSNHRSPVLQKTPQLRLRHPLLRPVWQIQRLLEHAQRQYTFGSPRALSSSEQILQSRYKPVDFNGSISWKPLNRLAGYAQAINPRHRNGKERRSSRYQQDNLISSTTSLK